MSKIESHRPDEGSEPRIRRNRTAAPFVQGVAALGFVLLSSAGAAWSQDKSTDLTSQSLEDLMNIQVTSVSKKEEKLSRTPAAVFVITQADIQQSAATNIPDLLRMVPGLDVGQVNASVWGISVRGFDLRYSDKLLVLVDGRTVYSPTFSGVYWDVLDMPLEDIERIEVIRGPGGIIWGSNAVNGVINIITKKASETHGPLATATDGTQLRGLGTAQFGGSVGSSADFRVYTKFFNQDHLPEFQGLGGADGWHVLRGGFRLDDDVSQKDHLTVQGDIYAGSEGVDTATLTSIAPPVDVIEGAQVPVSGGFLQGTWDRTFSPNSAIKLNVSFQQYQRNDHLREGRRASDIDFEHHYTWGTRHDFVWGVDYRYSPSHSDGDLTVFMTPADVTNTVFSFFAQDEISLVPDKLELTIGARVERNTYTGWGAMPTIRSTWILSKNQTAWAAVSRPLRTPGESERAIGVSAGGFIGAGGIPIIITIKGNPNFQDETLIAYEAGYRAMVRQGLSLDFAAYYNDYGQLRTSETGAPFFTPTPLPPHLVLPIVYSNLMHGESHGLEIFGKWNVVRRWELSPGYAFEQIHAHLAAASNDTRSVGEAQGSSPVHSAQIRSHVDLSHGVTWDAAAYFVDRLPDLAVPAYTGVDSGLTWKFGKGFGVSLEGENLASDHHVEFQDDSRSAFASLIKRSGYVRITWSPE